MAQNLNEKQGHASSTKDPPTNGNGGGTGERKLRFLTSCPNWKAEVREHMPLWIFKLIFFLRVHSLSSRTTGSLNLVEA
ncbi:hypothetical protein EUGRSUZ_H02156 [Eucalyptus grandis]|uniref:Uncharacterized protein n=2 Tax=Eucalyptus grandis TaxID=71139 RepID=A0ACC3JT82_EUCGR|nr:hypothetical protein EUGRSUZ_H02156 [Eucalyptus grandis]